MSAQAIGNRIRSRREELGLTMDDVAAEIGLNKSTIQRYESGSIRTIKLPVIEAIARVLDVDAAWLCCKTDKMHSFPANVSPLLPMKKIPLVGEIACGAPILAEQHITDYVDMPEHIRADFALKCRGDSMVGAGIRDGDIVYIRQQPIVNNGQIAAVLIDGSESEATLKRFYLSDDVLTLQAENPSVPPKIFIGGEIEEVRVLGLAVGYTHMLEV